MTKVVEVTTPAQLDTIVAEEALVVVDFAAESWCVPCQRFRPHFDKVAETQDDTVFVHVDVDESPELRALYEIQTVPTVLAFVSGAPVPIQARTAPALVRELQSLGG